MKKYKRNKNLFWKIYAVSMAVLTAIVAVLLIVGYNIMLDYDKAQGVLMRTADKVAGEIAAGNYDSLFTGSELPASLVFEKNTYIKHIRELVEESGGVSARKGFSSDRYTKPVYDIVAGEKRIASLQFTMSKKKSRFGFDTFALESIKPVTDGRYEVVVLVPENTELYLNDNVFVERRWAVETVKTGNQSNSLYVSETSAEESGVCTKYKIDGLLEAPVPKVIYTENGTAAEMYYDEELKAWRCRSYEIEIVAPSNCSVQVNGVTVSGEERFIKEKNIEAEDIAAAQKYTDNKISLTKYCISGIVNTDSLKISAFGFDGAECKVAYNEKSGVYEVFFGGSSAALEKYGVKQEFLLERAREYAKFITNDGDLWGKVLPYVLEGTAVYKDFSEFWVTYSRHDSYWIENEKLENVNAYSAELFSARVTMDYWVKGFNGNKDNTKTHHVDITFYYALKNGEWKIVDWMLG